MTAPEWSDEDFDEYGQWKHTCDTCGTNHDGHPPGTVGGEMACLRTRAVALGADHLVDQVDAARRNMAERRDGHLRGMGLIP